MSNPYIIDLTDDEARRRQQRTRRAEVRRNYPVNDKKGDFIASTEASFIAILVLWNIPMLLWLRWSIKNKC